MDELGLVAQAHNPGHFRVKPKDGKFKATGATEQVQSQPGQCSKMFLKGGEGLWGMHKALGTMSSTERGGGNGVTDVCPEPAGGFQTTLPVNWKQCDKNTQVPQALLVSSCLNFSITTEQKALKNPVPEVLQPPYLSNQQQLHTRRC